MNKVHLLGRLTRDPEIRYSQAETNNVIANFTVAVNRKFTNKNGEREADFINVSTFGKTAEVVQNYFKKGSRILVSGRINTRNWDDDKGVRHYVTEVVAEDVEFVDTKKESEGINRNSFGSQGIGQSNIFDSSSIQDLDASDFNVNSENDLPF